MLTNRARHPIHSFMLQALSLIKVTFRITVTVGHIPGVKNVFADAASRKFGPEVLNAQALLAEMNMRPRLPFPSGLIRNIQAFARRESSDISQSVHSALTALEDVRGWISLR